MTTIDEKVRLTIEFIKEFGRAPTSEELHLLLETKRVRPAFAPTPDPDVNNRTQGLAKAHGVPMNLIDGRPWVPTEDEQP